MNVEKPLLVEILKVRFHQGFFQKPTRCTVRLYSDFIATYALNDPYPNPPNYVVLFNDATELMLGTEAPTAHMCVPIKDSRESRTVFILHDGGTLELRAPSASVIKPWIQKLKLVIGPRKYPHGSFAPNRAGNTMKWMVDGAMTFARMFEILSQAEREIMIAGWWITPDMELLRDLSAADTIIAGDLRIGNAPNPLGSFAALEEIGVGQTIKSMAHEAHRILMPSGQDSTETKPTAGGTKGLVSREDSSDTVPPKAQDTSLTSLKEVLRLKAAKGVQIYILMYQEVVGTLPLESAYQKISLSRLSSNIYVLRQGSWFWSNHGKLITVDRTVAFVGGLDIAWGRWDHGAHIICDPARQFFAHGVDYYNAAHSDYAPPSVNQIDPDRFDRSRKPRMAWHDVHTMMVGPSVQDVVYYFVQRWNWVKVDKKKDHIPFLIPGFGNWHRSAVTTDTRPPDMSSYEDSEQAKAPGLVEEKKILSEKRSKLDKSLSASEKQGLMHANLIGYAMKVAKYGVGTPWAGILPRPSGSSKVPIMTTEYYCSRDWSREPCRAQVQVVRSLGPWSGGVDSEHSIFSAYIDLILNAKHFIYIENQYFITSIRSDGIQRVAEAMDRGAPFSEIDPSIATVATTTAVPEDQQRDFIRRARGCSSSSMGNEGQRSMNSAGHREGFAGTSIGASNPDSSVSTAPISELEFRSGASGAVSVPKQSAARDMLISGGVADFRAAFGLPEATERSEDSNSSSPTESTDYGQEFQQQRRASRLPGASDPAFTRMSFPTPPSQQGASSEGLSRAQNSRQSDHESALRKFILFGHRTANALHLSRSLSMSRGTRSLSPDRSSTMSGRDFDGNESDDQMRDYRPGDEGIGWRRRHRGHGKFNRIPSDDESTGTWDRAKNAWLRKSRIEAPSFQEELENEKTTTDRGWRKGQPTAQPVTEEKWEPREYSKEEEKQLRQVVKFIERQWRNDMKS